MSNKKIIKSDRTKALMKKKLHEDYNLFDSVPISLIEMDFSGVKQLVDDLYLSGNTDFNDYLVNNPDIVTRLIEKAEIIDVNKATIFMYEAETKDELFNGVRELFDESAYNVFQDGFIAMAGGDTGFAGDALIKTRQGRKNYVSLRLVIVHGYETTWSRVLLSLTDISKRKQVEQQLKDSYEYLEKLNNTLQEVIFTVKLPDRIIEYTNHSIEHVFGYKAEECIGKTTAFLYPSLSGYYSFGNKLNNIIEKGEHALNTEHMFIRKNGEIFPAEVTINLLLGNDKILRVISVLRDVTQRKSEEAQLKESEARLAEAQRIAHLGYWDWDIEQNLLLWSDEVYRIFGLTPRIFEATYEAFLERVHPDDRESLQKAVDESLSHGKPYNIDHRIILPDGSVRVVYEKGEVTFNESGSPIRLIGTVHDITERKRAEDELRALSHTLVNLQENERRTLGRELHDEIGQSLTALQLQLNCITRMKTDDIKEELDQAQKQVAEIMKSIRELSVDLNPTMLDNLGLLPALNWQLDRFSKLAHIDVQFTHRGLKRNFSPEIILSTYRIIQEALTNVALHSRVNEAAVTVLSKNRTINIIVEDKGKGFYLNTLDVRNSSGLSGMRERALAMGGKLNIETSPGTGTRVVAALPLQNRPKRKSLKHE